MSGSPSPRPSTERDAFAAATAWFVDVVRDVDGRWDEHGLGEWTVRDLVGHTARALLTVETYLAQPATREEVADAAGYYLLGRSVDPASIAARGREAGAAMGVDVVADVAGMAQRAFDAVAEAPDGALLTTRLGGMRLDRYLDTRTLELVVHTLDLAAALGRPPDDAPAAALTRVLVVLAELAVRSGDGPAVCLALAGRRPLPERYSAL